MSAKLRVTMWVTLQMLILSAFIIVFFCVVYGEAITDDPQGRLQKVVEKNYRRLKIDEDGFNWNRIKFYKHGVYTVCYSIDVNILHGVEIDNIDLSQFKSSSSDGFTLADVVKIKRK